MIDLLGRLGGDIIAFIEARLGLLRLELADEIKTRARQALTLLVGAFLAGTAVLLASVALTFALAFLARRWIPNPELRYALAFLLVASAHACAGALLFLRGWRGGSRTAPARSTTDANMKVASAPSGTIEIPESRRERASPREARHERGGA